uniref:Flagellar protein FliL n=1 Tax=Panagrolaimus davidi TaxID=227884 RepID=A0A914QEV9_9BILA
MTKINPNSLNNYFSSKFILLILLILVSIILIILIVVIIVLFATGVFTTQQAVNSSPINPNIQPTTLPPNADFLVNRTFDCQMFVVDQANPLFNNQTSVEYQQAFLMLQNGLSTMIQQSTLRDLQPLIAVTNLQNQNPDLQINFLLSIIIPSRSPINASAIRNLLLSELQLLENQLNGSDIDRGRITVIMTSI